MGGESGRISAGFHLSGGKKGRINFGGIHKIYRIGRRQGSRGTFTELMEVSKLTELFFWESRLGAEVSEVPDEEGKDRNSELGRVMDAIITHPEKKR